MEKIDKCLGNKKVMKVSKWWTYVFIAKFSFFQACGWIWAAAQILLVSLKIVFNVSRFKPVLNWNLFLADLRRGSNSLISDTDLQKWFSSKKYTPGTETSGIFTKTKDEEKFKYFYSVDDTEAAGTPRYRYKPGRPRRCSTITQSSCQHPFHTY